MSRESFMIEELVKDLVLQLMETDHLSISAALETVYNSDTYEKILDTETGLYSQSTAYVFSILEREVRKGKIMPE